MNEPRVLPIVALSLAFNPTISHFFMFIPIEQMSLNTLSGLLSLQSNQSSHLSLHKHHQISSRFDPCYWKQSKQSRGWLSPHYTHRSHRNLTIIPVSCLQPHRSPETTILLPIDRSVAALCRFLRSQSMGKSLCPVWAFVVSVRFTSHHYQWFNYHHHKHNLLLQSIDNTPKQFLHPIS